jgi:hypothetical protein
MKLFSRLMAVDTVNAVLALSPLMLAVCAFARAVELGLLP